MRPDSDPWPLAPGDLDSFFTSIAAGTPFRESFEELLARLPAARVGRLLQLHSERRGAWLALLREPGGRALILGNALTGSAAPLTAAGYDVTLADASPDRLRLARLSSARQDNPGVRCVCVDENQLPFADESFELVVLDDDRRAGPTTKQLDEARRVCAGELVVLCDNRLAYKRSSGRWQDLRVRSPLDFLRRALLPRAGERTLRLHLNQVQTNEFEPATALALYPDRRDFAHIVDLSNSQPSLWVGPNEARNRLKVLGKRLGLFPWLAPSFAILARRRGRPHARRRIERVLATLANRLDEPEPFPEHVFATRGNTSVILTAVVGDNSIDPRGRWALHVPLYAAHTPGLETHLDALRTVRERFPSVPVPEPLHSGPVDGLWVSVERRAPGVPAQHLLHDAELADHVLLQAAEHFARLATKPAMPLTHADFDTLVSARCESVARKAPDVETRRAIDAIERNARKQLVGAPLPRVLQHGDLRAKHVQVTLRGEVLAYVDWGTASTDELPMLDVAHLLVHDAKQRTKLSDGVLWRRMLDKNELRPAERRALQRHAELLGIDAEISQALLALYPISIGAIAEANWPWTRPGWFRRTYGL